MARYIATCTNFLGATSPSIPPEVELLRLAAELLNTSIDGANLQIASFPRCDMGLEPVTSAVGRSQRRTAGKILTQYHANQLSNE